MVDYSRLAQYKVRLLGPGGIEPHVRIGLTPQRAHLNGICATGLTDVISGFHFATVLKFPDDRTG